jgi:hypothetical protein
MEEWNSVTDGIFPHASLSVVSLAQEPFPSRFICHNRFDKFNAVRTISAAPFWILVMEDDKQGFVFVNNRLEGNALNTIAAVVSEIAGEAVDEPRIEQADECAAHRFAPR